VLGRLHAGCCRNLKKVVKNKYEDSKKVGAGLKIGYRRREEAKEKAKVKGNGDLQHSAYGHLIVDISF
jgi:hypothetical protein